MADDWNSPPGGPPGGPPQEDTKLPGPGESWADHEPLAGDQRTQPRPLDGDQWGSAPSAGGGAQQPDAHRQTPGAGFGAPNAGFGAPGAGPAPGPGGHPPHAMTPSQSSGDQLMERIKQLETNDYLYIIGSLFLPGVGHILMGQVKKGALILALALFTCFGAGLVPVVVALDALFVALAKREREVDEWEFFPK